MAEYRVRMNNFSGFSTGLIPVNSSAIRAVGYDGNTLAVQFHNGRVYDHPGVPYSVYLGLIQACSIGAYYNRYIRGRYY